MIKTTRLIPLLAAGMGLIGPAALAQGTKAPAKPKPAANVQRATVTINLGYQPATVKVKAGHPVALTLVRTEKMGCGDVVQFPSLGIKRTLKTGEKTTINFTPKKTGTIAFTCGENMYKGQILVQ